MYEQLKGFFFPTKVDSKITGGKKVRLFKWDTSATNLFNLRGLNKLRDENPHVLANLLPEREDQKNVIIEFIGHGNPRKAALLIKALIKKNSLYEQTLREDLADHIFDTLTKTEPMKLASTPQECKSFHHPQLALLS